MNIVKLIELINKGDFKLAEIEFNSKSFLLCKKEIEEEAYINPSAKLYGFLKYIITSDPNNKEYHEFTSELLATALNHIDNNGYSKALIHAKEVIRIEPDDIDNWEWLLFFYDMPDKLINKEELHDIIIKMLQIENENIKARKFLASEFNEGEISEILEKI